MASVFGEKALGEANEERLDEVGLYSVFCTYIIGSSC